METLRNTAWGPSNPSSPIYLTLLDGGCEKSRWCVAYAVVAIAAQPCVPGDFCFSIPASSERSMFLPREAYSKA